MAILASTMSTDTMALGAVMMLGNLSCRSRVNITVAWFVSGLGSLARTGRVTLKLHIALGARLPQPLAMAVASRSPSKVSVKLSLAVPRVRLGLSDELVLVTWKL